MHNAQCTMHRSRDNIPCTCDTCNMAAFPSLVERLKEELECSVCRNVYTDPKTLPCLHTFCCHCLNQLAERRENREPIACPDCRTEINLPPGSNFDSFPSSFYLNRLRDIVSVQHEGHQVLCGSCDKKSTAIAFCFSCECFICAQCRDSHSQLKITKGHRMTAFDQIQDTDVQEILRRPQLCQEPYHPNEVLEYFCKSCQQCICQKCGMLGHKNHEFVHLDEAADEAKSRLEENKTNIGDRVGVCREQMNKDQQTYRKIEEEIEATEQAIQHNTQRFIELAKRHEREMLTQLSTIREDLERRFRDHKENLELRLGQLNSVTDYLDSVLERAMNGEILEAERSVLNRAQELLNASTKFQSFHNVRVDYQPNEYSYRCVEKSVLGRVFVGFADPAKTQIQGLLASRIHTEERAQFTIVTKDSEEKICYSPLEDVSVRILSPAGDNVETEIEDRKDGTYTVCFTPRVEGVHRVSVRVGGQLPGEHPLDVHVTRRRPRGYKYVTMFGSPGRGEGQFSGVSVSSTGEVAVSDCFNHRVQIFSADGQYLRRFGKEGTADGQFRGPTGLCHNSAGNIIIADSDNSRVQVFSPAGRWISKFGQGVLKSPWGVSVTSDDNIVVCDQTERTVNVFSSEGMLLLCFAATPAQYSIKPRYVIFHDDKFFVSGGIHVKVFDTRGSHLYDIGLKGKSLSRSCETRGLAVNTKNSLLVCDKGNKLVHLVTLDGEVVTSFGEGKLCWPQDISITPQGLVMVSDWDKHCVFVFHPEY